MKQKIIPDKLFQSNLEHLIRKEYFPKNKDKKSELLLKDNMSFMTSTFPIEIDSNLSRFRSETKTNTPEISLNEYLQTYNSESNSGCRIKKNAIKFSRRFLPETSLLSKELKVLEKNIIKPETINKDNMKLSQEFINNSRIEANNLLNNYYYEKLKNTDVCQIMAFLKDQDRLAKIKEESQLTTPNISGYKLIKNTVLLSVNSSVQANTDYKRLKGLLNMKRGIVDKGLRNQN